ncbi:MAG: nucleotide exchange factor GrpE [Lachnospiraceae bacterium]|nr:nucleotide exchange factor GrpE [Lachnospiraceae bacterium]
MENTTPDETAEEAVPAPEDAAENTAEGTADDQESQSETKTAEQPEHQAGEAAEESGQKPEGNAKESKKLFKGKEKAEKKKDKTKELVSELEDRVKRQMAEFDNFRKRTEKEKAQMFEIGAKSVIEKILPVVDNFERGLMTVPEDENSKAFVDGMKMIYKQLMTELETIGVTPIEAVGQEFNPDLHNAVMQVESDEYESGIVAQELQKGYMYRDTVVRHSMVAVVQ